MVNEQLMDDPRASWLIIKIMGLYLTYVARKTDDNRLLNKAECDYLVGELLTQLNMMLGRSVEKKILLLLQTQPDDYRLSVVLYPIAERVHKELLARRRSSPKYPGVTAILIVLFYKYWKEMVTVQEDIDELTRNANEVLVFLLDSMPLSLNQNQNTLLLHTSERLYHILRLHTNVL